MSLVGSLPVHLSRILRMVNICETYILNIYDLVELEFMAYINKCRLFNDKFFCIHIYQIYMIWFGSVLWDIRHCR